MDDDFDRAMAILQAHQDKSFVQRILQPDNYPSLDLGNGQVATHKMAWGQLGDQYVVYPTVLMNAERQLQDYGNEAWRHAKASNNYIPFPTSQEAEWFSQNYKAGWGGKRNNRP